eukprot:GEMP01038297.1.p1 GENE.GEMP01038297.1~~GEMP01038297.1.p1  ORF type:complete len:528 (+),score=132.46 GEMP01038297.1:129-1712(+)
MTQCMELKVAEDQVKDGTPTPKWRPPNEYFAQHLRALLVEIVHFSLESWGIQDWHVFLQDMLAPVVESLASDLLLAQPHEARRFAVNWIKANEGFDSIDEQVLNVLMEWIENSGVPPEIPATRKDDIRQDFERWLRKFHLSAELLALVMTHFPGDPVEFHDWEELFDGVMHTHEGQQLLEPLVLFLAEQQAEVDFESSQVQGLLSYEAFGRIWSKHQRHDVVVDKLWCAMDKRPDGGITKRSFFELLGFDDPGGDVDAVGSVESIAQNDDFARLMNHLNQRGICSAKQAFRHLGGESMLCTDSFVLGFTRDDGDLEECATRVAKTLAAGEDVVTFDAFKRHVSYFLASSPTLHAVFDIHHLHAVLRRILQKAGERPVGLKELFMDFDQEDGGGVPKALFFKVLQDLKLDLSDKEMEQLFAAMDYDGDLQISKKEFLRVMKYMDKTSPTRMCVLRFLRSLALERLHTFFENEGLEKLDFGSFQKLVDGADFHAMEIWDLLGGAHSRSFALDAIYRALPFLQEETIDEE